MRRIWLLFVDISSRITHCFIIVLCDLQMVVFLTTIKVHHLNLKVYVNVVYLFLFTGCF